MNDKPERWGKPLAALLGARDAQVGLGIASIGGKDSMSGSFEGLDVPPTLVSFATAIGNTHDVQSPEFKKANSSVVILRPNYKNGLPEIGSLISIYKTVEQMIDEGKVLAAATPGYGGVAEALFKMCVGNHVGLQLSNDIDLNDLFKPAYGAVILELLDASAGEFLGFTTVDYTLEAEGKAIDLARLQELWEQKLEPVFPYRKAGEFVPALEHDCPANKRVAPAVRLATPRVVSPVCPGTNWVNEFTIAIIGLPNCSSFIPLARHSARAPAILRPSVLNELLNGFFISFLFFVRRALYPRLYLDLFIIKKPFPIWRKA